MWLYVPNMPASTSSPSAPEGEDWTAPSSWRSQLLAQSCVWRGKHSPSLHWSRRLRTVSWLRRLSTAMCEPSQAASSVAAWMASLEESPASRIPWPAAGAAAPTSATSGARPGGSSPRRGHGSSSSRTSPASSRRGLTKSLAPHGYEETYESWVSRLRAASSARRTWASRTSASASSSSGSLIGSWPMPATEERSENPETFQRRRSLIPAGRRMGPNGTLGMAVRAWPTPTANDCKGSGPTVVRSDGKTRGDRLDYAVEQFWPTPTSLSFARSHQPGNSRAYNRTMELAAGINWSTPRATDGEKGGPNQSFGAGGTPLPAMAASWQTPRVTTGDYTRDRGARGAERLTLEGQAKWSTPSVADVAGGRKARSGSRSGELLNNSLAPYVTNNVWPTATAVNRPRNDDTLAKCGAYRKAKAGQNTVPLYLEEVALSSDLLAPETSTPGGTSPSSLLASYRRYRATTDCALRWERRALLLLAIRRRGRGWTRKPASVFTRPSFRRQLNARFVEWLMSWPPGLTSFECSETALLTHKALWRSELASMTSLPAAPPAQLSLFG